MEAIGGKALTEKLPGILPFPVVMRVVVPGAVVVLSLLPITWSLVKDEPLLSTWGPRALVGSLLVLAIGIILSLMDVPIYHLYEGYILWPERWFKKGVSFQKKRVTERLEETNRSKEAETRLREDANTLRKDANTLRAVAEQIGGEDAEEAKGSAEIERANKKLEDANVLEETATQKMDEANYLELCYDKLWLWLRMFPADNEGNPVARCPTLLGNILRSYEDYPNSRYGMDAGFYWPRLWLSLEDDKKKSLESRWSVADGVLYSSFGLAFSAVIYLLLAIVNLGIVNLPVVGLARQTTIGPLAPGWNFLITIPMFCAAYLAYRLSLPYHRQNGESFMALFDLYRDNLSAMDKIGEAERRKWDTVWAYLQYLVIRCECKQNYDSYLSKCPACGTKTGDNLKRIRADSKCAERTNT